MKTDPEASKYQSEIRRAHSNLHHLLMALFALSLAGILITILTISAADRRGARDEATDLELLHEVSQIENLSHSLTLNLATAGGDKSQDSDTNGLFLQLRSRIDRLDRIAVGDVELVVDEQTRQLTELADEISRKLAKADGLEPITPAQAIDLAQRLTSTVSSFSATTHASVMDRETGDHLSTTLRLLNLAGPTAALLLLLALNYVRNRDMRLSYLDVRSQLDTEDNERQRIQRLALAQTNAMELIAAGAHRRDIESEVAEMVEAATNSTWSVGSDGLAPTVVDASPLAPDLALAVERILSVTSARDRSAADLVFEATHDGLTKLHNRKAVLEHIHRVMQQRRDDQSIAVVYMDLDGFKYVNDTFGHSFGDDALCEVARRLESSARRGDFVGRVGGDEFVAVLYPVTSEAADMVAERIVDSVGQPFNVRDVTVDIGLSMGVSFANPGDTDPDVMMREADHAMYKAKRTRQQIVVADEQLRQADRDQHEIEKRIGEALAGDGIAVQYQPIVDTATGRLHGVEALARLRMGDDMLAPATFIEIAEHTGQIIDIDRRVLSLASAQVADWNRKFATVIELAVNISAVHVSRGNSLSDLHATLEQSGLPAELLNIEINEAVFLRDMIDVSKRIDSIRRHGVKFSIDDFGTGYSSFGYLQKLPVDTLKIDKMFIDEIENSHAERAIVKSILEVAVALELNVVAEGIETPEQLEILQHLGCPLSQGYHFAKPLDPNVFEHEWLTA